MLQGWTLADYLHCLDLYRQAGIDLTTLPLVGLGSICRRQATNDIRHIVTELAAAGLRLHGFGVRTAGLAAYGAALASADSMAWSLHARRQPPLPGCRHANCANCLRYALHWRAELAARLLWPTGRRQVTKPGPNGSPRRSRFVTCLRCRTRVRQAATGRPPRYCGPACRKASQRARLCDPTTQETT